MSKSVRANYFSDRAQFVLPLSLGLEKQLPGDPVDHNFFEIWF